MEKLPGQSGQMLLLAIIVVGLVLINTLVIISNSQLFSQNSYYQVNKSQAVQLAEAGADKAVASLNATGGIYGGDDEIFLAKGSFSVKITDKDAATKIIESTAYIPDKTNTKVRKTVKVETSKGMGASFNYGMQVGEGGLQIGNVSKLIGSIYSNGNITAGNNSQFTGDVWIAGGVQPTPDQESDCTDSCPDYIFGKNVGGEDRRSVAQSFKSSTSGVINKVELKLKKAEAPPNLTVRLLADNSGKPSKTVLASGALYANFVVTNPYSFVGVAFTSPPTLTADTTYWIMIDTILDNNNYWYWSKDFLGGYSRGSPAWSPDWSAGSPGPYWYNNITGDLNFKTYMGGVPTSLTLGPTSWVNGNVHANTISGGTIYKDAYFQTISGSTVQGTSYPGSADPPPQVFPISDANIAEWQEQARSGGEINNSVSGCNMTLGPKKIIGNLTIGNSCTVTVNSPLWVTGDITLGNGSKFVLDSSFGTSSGMVIVGGQTTFGNTCDLVGSGAPGSFMMLLSTYDSRTSGTEAIETGNGAFSGVMYAPYGKIELANGSKFKEISAWKIELGNNAELTYDTGLANLFFSSGPQGSYSLIRGTYQLK